jgi:hypothetical protein
MVAFMSWFKGGGARARIITVLGGICAVSGECGCGFPGRLDVVAPKP